MVANFILEDSNQLNLNLLFFFLRRVTKIGHENTEQAGWDDGIPGVATTDSVFFLLCRTGKTQWICGHWKTYWSFVGSLLMLIVDHYWYSFLEPSLVPEWGQLRKGMISLRICGTYPPPINFEPQQFHPKHSDRWILCRCARCAKSV